MKKFGLLLPLLLQLAFGSVANVAGQGIDVIQFHTLGLFKNNVTFGVYDPQSAFSNAFAVDIEHIFIFWQALDMEAFEDRLRYAEKRGRSMMVTVEPYTRAANWRDGGEHLFDDIVAGMFDEEINTICTELGGFKGRVLIRWGHEMEDPTGRYPWARDDSEGFKAAYRYFVTSCRQVAPEALFVWSPKGEKNLADYYPGSGYADVVGVALWGLEKMDVDYYGGQRDFVSTFKEKYDRVDQFGKPVIIAELGVSGSKNYRDQWFDSLFDEIRSSNMFSELRAVVYFNDKEPYHWPHGFGSPDWRIQPSMNWFSRARMATKSCETALCG